MEENNKEVNKNDILIVLFPFKNLELSGAQKEFIMNSFDISLELLNELITTNFTEAELKASVADKTDEEKQEYFRKAKLISEKNILLIGSYDNFAKFGKLLNIPADKTGFDFNIYDKETSIDNEATQIIRSYSIVAAAFGFLPIPIPDLILLLPTQVSMITNISTLYRFNIDSDRFIKMIIGVSGVSIIGKSIASIGVKLIPILGWIINGSLAFATTYAIGIITKKYIEAEGKIDKESIKEIYKNSLAEGKIEFNKLKDIILEKKDEIIKKFNEMKEKKMSTDNEKSNGNEENNGSGD